jgi:hypothetical protein
MNKRNIQITVALIAAFGLIVAAAVTGGFGLLRGSDRALQSNTIAGSNFDHSVIIQGNQSGNAISIDQSRKDAQVGSVGQNQGATAIGSNMTQSASQTNARSVGAGAAKP